MDNEKVVNSSGEKEGITLKDIFVIIRKHIISILAFIVAFTAAGFIGGKAKNKLSPEYSAHASMVVAAKIDNVSPTVQYQYSYNISATFVAFIKEDVVIDELANQTNISSTRIKNNLSVSLKTGTLIISLSYKNKDKEVASDTLNKLLIIVQNKANEQTELNGESTAKYPFLYGNISTLTPSSYEKVTFNGSTKKLTLIGFAVGFVAAICYVVIKELLDTTFKNDDEIEKNLELPVLADVPTFEFNTHEKENGGNK